MREQWSAQDSTTLGKAVVPTCAVCTCDNRIEPSGVQSSRSHGTKSNISSIGTSNVLKLSTLDVPTDITRKMMLSLMYTTLAYKSVATLKRSSSKR